MDVVYVSRSALYTMFRHPFLTHPHTCMHIWIALVYFKHSHVVYCFMLLVLFTFMSTMDAEIKCPFEAIQIINLPKDLDKDTTHRYGPNTFKLHRSVTQCHEIFWFSFIFSYVENY